MSLADKIRMARQARVTAGDHTFVIRRPTDLEMIEFREDPRAVTLLRFVVGWEGVREMDIITGGDPHPAAFDADTIRSGELKGVEVVHRDNLVIL